MKITCDTVSCKFCTDYSCTKEDGISIVDLECGDYMDYIMCSPEYRNVFYIRCKNKETGDIFKVKKFGKKFEFFNMTFYTPYDDRNGLELIKLTEARTGIAVKGGDLLQGDPVCIEKIKQGIEKCLSEETPLVCLPEREDAFV